MFQKISYLFLLSLALIYSCSKDDSNPASEIVLNGKPSSVDSVIIHYLGDGDALCYFIKKGQEIDSSTFAIIVSQATHENLTEGIYRYKIASSFPKTFFAPSIEDSITESSLVISKNDKGYLFNFTIKTDSLSISGYAGSSFEILDLAGRMYISGVRYEESKGAQVRQINEDSIQLNIMGSKLSYPQIAIILPCSNWTELPQGNFNISDGIKAKIYIDRNKTSILTQGEISIEKQSNGIYEFNYSFSFNDTIVKGFYQNEITYRKY